LLVLIFAPWHSGRQRKDEQRPEQELPVLLVLAEVDPLELVLIFYSFIQTIVQDFKLDQRLCWWHHLALWEWSYFCISGESSAYKQQERVEETRNRKQHYLKKEYNKKRKQEGPNQKWLPLTIIHRCDRLGMTT
jgi:hypothetical protein